MSGLPQPVADLIMKIDGPILEGKKLNFIQFFTIVLSLGGFQEVCAHLLWKNVLERLDLTGNSYESLIAIYKTQLLQYERHARSSHLSLHSKVNGHKLASSSSHQTVPRLEPPSFSVPTSSLQNNHPIRQSASIPSSYPLFEHPNYREIIERLFHLRRRHFLTVGLETIIEISKIISRHSHEDDTFPPLYFYRCPNLLDVISECLLYWNQLEPIVGRKRKQNSENNESHAEDICSILTLCYHLMSDRPTGVYTASSSCLVMSPESMNGSYAAQHSLFIQQLAIMIQSQVDGVKLLSLDVFSLLAPFIDYSLSVRNSVNLWNSNTSDRSNMIEIVETRGCYSRYFMSYSDGVYQSSLDAIFKHLTSNINQISFSHISLKSIEILIKLSSSAGNSGLLSSSSSLVMLLFNLLSATTNASISEGILSLVYGICEICDEPYLTSLQANVTEITTRGMSQLMSIGNLNQNQINQVRFIQSKLKII